jgi:hypothetical protein
LIDFINAQYAAFTNDFRTAEQLYLVTVTTGTTTQQTVTASLTQPYVPGSGVLTVDNASVFGTPTAAAPLQLTAVINSQPIQLLQATGLTGNILTGVSAFDPSTQTFSSNGVPLPTGTQVSATVTASGSDAASVASLFSTYVLQRAQQMSQDIVTYVNRTPVKLPRIPGEPRQPGPRIAVQLYATSAIEGTGSDSLLSGLFSIPLPTGTGASQILFDAATGTAIETSRTALLEGIRLLFANRGLYNPTSNPTTIPARGGNDANGFGFAAPGS